MPKCAKRVLENSNICQIIFQSEWGKKDIRGIKEKEFWKGRTSRSKIHLFVTRNGVGSLLVTRAPFSIIDVSGFNYLGGVSQMHYFPLSMPFLILLAFIFAVVVILIEIRILRYAYHEVGLGSRHMFALLALSLLGSYVNIPVAVLPAKEVVSDQMVSIYGVTHVIPAVRDLPRTVLAVNLGGTIIPTFLSIYLMVKNSLYGRALIAVAVVTAAVHLMAHPVPGIGIGEPIFIPPLVTAAIALIISRQYAPPLAYIAGSLGTLIGADLLNLGKVQGLGAPVASIGGAGTFDGIFVTGIVSVLLAGWVGSRKKASG